MRYLITGGNGLIGKSLVFALSMLSHKIVVTVRSSEHIKTFSNLDNVSVRTGIDLNSNIDWDALLTDVDCVIHCAALNNHTSGLQPEDFIKTNVDAVVLLLRACDKLRVKRFIYLSTVKSYNMKDEVVHWYEKSKYMADEFISKFSKSSRIEVVTLRLPPVYGPGSRGNLAKLVALVKSRMPLPLGSLKSRHSFIALDNLTDALILCSLHPSAAGKTYYVSDDNDLTVPEFVCLISKSLNLRCRVFSFPLIMLRYILYSINMHDFFARLSTSSSIDIRSIKNELGWVPPVTVEQGISQMVTANDKNA